MMCPKADLIRKLCLTLQKVKSESGGLSTNTLTPLSPFPRKPFNWSMEFQRITQDKLISNFS